MDLKFYKCSKCGQVVAVICKTGMPMTCCDEEMQELIPCSVDASVEKHVPYVEIKGFLAEVRIGEEEHPMLPEHHIEWIALQTKKGCQLVELNPNEAPKAKFELIPGDYVEAVYAYCNLHSLWRAEV